MHFVRIDRFFIEKKLLMRVNMGILSKLRSNKLKVSWRFGTKKPSEIIWKLLISPDGILAGEERDTELKTASLFALEVANGKILWRDAKIDEAWWFNSE